MFLGVSCFQVRRNCVGFCRGDPALNRIVKYIPQLPASDFKGETLYLRFKDKGRYRVRHSFWGRRLLSARLGSWCVGKQCTRAFFGDIVCDGICPRRPADPTCHFDKRDLCVSRR